MIQTLDWTGCYKRGWGNELVPEAFAHPAKISFSLTKRIYDFLFERDLLHAGDSVVDPFAGIGGCAYQALLHGCHFTGVELEEKFFLLANANIKMWNDRYAGKLPRFGTARVLNGDSRNFAEIVGNSHCAVSSPPYAAIATGAGGLNTKPARDGQQGGRNPRSASQDTDQHYGVSFGQLSTLPEGNYAAAISSPPYEEARIGETCGMEHVGRGENYGNGAGQLGNMTGGDYAAAVSSPPWETSVTRTNGNQGKGTYAGTDLTQGLNRVKDDYADMASLGEGETFWLASRTIIEQVYSVLAPRGVAVWIVKRFVRKGEIVEFSQQWAQLCEAVGFETTHWIRAMLVENNGSQFSMDGTNKILKTERKSFFRRLHEKKYPDTAINWEDVIVMKKC